MTQLYAGVGRELITPTGAGYLAGDVLDTDAEVQRVHQDLYAQSLFLTDRTTRLVLITVDVLKVSAAMVKAVVTKLGEELDLPGAAIMIAASHTHSAPHTVEDDAVPGTFDKGFAQQAAAGMIASALQAAGKLEPVSLRYEQGHSDLGVNKRLSTPWGVFMRANPAGAYDPEVGVLIAERAAGKPVAVLCCYASHPIGHLRSEISSDLSGFLRDELEVAFPNSMGFHALGCAGDVSPRMRWDGTDYEIGNPHTGAGRRLLPESAFKAMMEFAGRELASKAIALVKGGSGEPFAGPLSAAVATVELALSPSLSLTQVEAAVSLPLNHLHARWAGHMRAKLLAGEAVSAERFLSDASVANRRSPVCCRAWRRGLRQHRNAHQGCAVTASLPYDRACQPIPGVPAHGRRNPRRRLRGGILLQHYAASALRNRDR